MFGTASLSVWTSNILSPSYTLSPTLIWKDAILPSVIVGERAGNLQDVIIVSYQHRNEGLSYRIGLNLG